MNKVEELEQKWLRYKVKKVMTPFLGLSALTITLGMGYYFYDEGQDTLSSLVLSEKATNVLGVSMENNTTKVEVLKQPEIAKVADETPKPIVEVALTPIIPVIDMEKEERIPEHRTAKVKQQSKRTEKLVSAKKNQYLTPKELKAIIKTEQRVESVPRKTKKMEFKSTSVNYMDTLKTKFSKSKNPREALLIAKAYYKESNYVESEKWALSANKLNNSLEDSWLLFAKSKSKLGKKKEALKILVAYYKKSSSSKAKALIGQIKTGKL